MPYKEFHLDKIGSIILSLKCQDFLPFYQKIKTKSKAEYFLYCHFGKFWSWTSLEIRQFDQIFCVHSGLYLLMHFFTIHIYKNQADTVG